MHEDAWHTAEADWRIAQVRRIEPTLEGSDDHYLGRDTITH